MRAKKVGIYCANPQDGTAWWRAISPFSHLDRAGYLDGYQFKVMREDGFRVESPFLDLIVMQRPFKESHYEMVIEAHNRGIPVWVDYDDNVLDVPLANPAHQTYDSAKVKHQIAQIMTLADMITVTTEDLAKVYSTFGEVRVIPNAFDERLTPKRDVRLDTKTIAWRGSRTHDEDLLEYLPAIQRVAEKRPDWKWAFIGKPYFMVQKYLPKAILWEPSYGALYWMLLRKISPELAIVPLTDNRFNRCKSNIAWLEFSYAGAATICPDWKAWEDAEIKYRTEEEFEATLERLTACSPNLRRGMAERAWSTIERSCTLATVNKLRASLLREMLE